MTARSGGAILLVLASLILAAACGRAPESPVATTATIPTAEPDLTPVPAGPTGTPPEPTEFAPPTPTCPAPTDPIGVPDVTVSIAGGPAMIATRGSSTFVTCSTVATIDAALPDPETGLTAHKGDRLTLALPPGWQFLRVEGFDHPAVGDGGNVSPPIDTPQRPTTFDAPVPFRPGASIADYTLTIVSVDGSVIGTLDIRFMTSLAST
jgi:hypothetical protein